MLFYQNPISIKVKIAILCLMVFLIGTYSTYAQDKKEEKHHKEKKDKKKKKPDGIIIIPVLASNPANGFMYGIAPSRNWQTKPDSATSYSSILGTLVFTTKSQFLFTMKGTVFMPENKDIFMLDARYFITSQPTFGLGTGPQSSKLASNGFEYEGGAFSKPIEDPQLMEFDFIRIYGTYFKNLDKPHLYAGVGYHLDRHYKIKDNLLNLDTIPRVITSDYAYSTEFGFKPDNYTLSGISGNLMYDTRDNTVDPYKGVYSFTRLKYNPKFLGSDQTSASLWLEGRTYVNVKKSRPRNLVAFWMYGDFKLGGGKIPYLDLPALGWDQYGRSGRGYPQGRFRGEQLMYGEVEWRFPLQKNKDKWGGVIFLNGTTASNKYADINLFKYINPGYGLGLRFALNEKSRTNLCLDYGWGSYGSSGFYLSVNEVF